MSASSSMASLSRRLLSRSLYHSNPNTMLSMRFYTTTTTTHLTSSDSSDSDESITSDLESDPTPDNAQSQPSPEARNRRRDIYDRPLEDGVDVGIYKAILVGQVGQSPLQKQLKSGPVLTIFSIGTGGIRNNRRPYNNENPTEYANRCAIQWHRVCIYPERLGMVAVKNATPGSILYLEGNLETKIFTDPRSGLVRRVREIAVRKNGRLVFLGKGNDAEPTQTGLKGVGYY